MTPIELSSRRKRLGLSQEEFGRCVSLVSPMADGTPRPPVKQSTIASWEGNRGIPHTIEPALDEILEQIEDMSDRMCDRIRGIIEHSSAVRNSPVVTVKAYTSDFDMWADWPDLTGWPHVLWNVAATVAMDEAAEEHGIACVMSA